MERPTFEAMLEAAIGVERDGSEYTVAEGYGLSVYIGKPGQAIGLCVRPPSGAGGRRAGFS
jgi:hypothetical protein